MGNAAIHTNIQRWTPPCGCVIEQTVDMDLTLVPGMKFDDFPDGHPPFLLMNRVCAKHKPLASVKYRADHEEKSNYVMKLLEETKQRNVTTAQARIDAAERQLEREELQSCMPLVHAHNAKITREWTELVDLVHAHDSHIYEQIKSEIKNGL